jgi:DNA sulfur modification protein DndD
MKFTSVKISNFRQYYGDVVFDLSTNKDKNIVLIGGRNGFGKTNFLISLVWCLYGRQIEKVDDNFKKEIQKEKNYDSFMQQSINKTALKEDVNSFSISITLEGVNFPESSRMNDNSNRILITRSRNTNTTEEKLSILDVENNIEIFDDEIDKFNFINDYIIPIDAAKFVFFDAEKIADIANLSIKEEGSFINDALGKILGLDTYETLIEDFEFYVNNLKKEGATGNLQEQIINKETTIELSNLKINKLEEENASKFKEIDDLKKQIRYYDNLISSNSKNGNSDFNRELIIDEIEKLKEREQALNEKFNELSEIIPFTILTGELEDIKNHIIIQEKNDTIQGSLKENEEKIDTFIELLFNKPPEPENSTLSFKDKSFYYEKAKKLSIELYNNNDDFQELTFEHDLNNSEKNLINDAYNLVNSQSLELFQNTINGFNEINLKKNQLLKTLNRIDSDLEDEIILEYLAEKETSEHNIMLLNRKIGENNNQINELRADIVKLNKQLIDLRNRVDINSQNKLKINEVEKYIDALNVFLEEQKNSHKESLQSTILKELKLLMHKLSSDDNLNTFIEDVEVVILASGQGMKIRLLDQDDNEIRKESLSSGEKQIYISCLIKAILNESIQDLPIFIDTPLGRLDEKHRDSITKNYYPQLSEQVILFSTDSEITPKRFRDIAENVSKSYILVNDGANTNIKPGYFNTSSNG